MRTTDIARIYDHSGPFLTLYLATSGDVENAGQRVELRWKNVRAGLLQEGVPEDLLDAVDPLVEGSHLAGATLALVASVDRVLWSANLPDPPPRETLLRHGATSSRSCRTWRCLPPAPPPSWPPARQTATAPGRSWWRASGRPTSPARLRAAGRRWRRRRSSPAAGSSRLILCRSPPSRA